MLEAAASAARADGALIEVIASVRLKIGAGQPPPEPPCLPRRPRGSPGRRVGLVQARPVGAWIPTAATTPTPPLPVGAGYLPPGTACGHESTSATIRFRVASSGSRPMPPPMLSSMCFALLVPARAKVTAGWLMTYLRKNCAHVLASKSAAHSGRGV